MRSTITRCIALLLSLNLACCSGNGDGGGSEPDGKLYVAPQSLHFSTKNPRLTLNISSDTHWEITASQTWLAADPATGSGDTKVTVTASDNPTAHPRTARLDITYGNDRTAAVEVVQEVDSESVVDMFSSAEELREYLLDARDAGEYVDQLRDDGRIIRISATSRSARGVEKGSIPLFTVTEGGGTWAADGNDTGVEANAETVRNILPQVEVSGGRIVIEGADTGVAAPAANTGLGLTCIIDTGKHICFVFTDGRNVMLGSQTGGKIYNPPLPASPTSLRILFIGNSFTYDATEHLGGMLQKAGIDNVYMAMAYHGGYTLPQYLDNYTSDNVCTLYVRPAGTLQWTAQGEYNSSLKSAVEAQEWDIVTLQEHTGNAAAWSWSNTEKTAISGLCDLIQTAHPGHRPTICYILSQAYGKTNTTVLPRFASQKAMFETIVEQCRRIMTETCIDIVIPTGTTLQNLRTTSLNNSMDLTRDSYHMDYGISRYAAAACVFASIITPCTGVSVEGNAYRYSNRNTSSPYYSTPVTDANAPIAIEAALKACRKPFEVTDMSNR